MLVLYALLCYALCFALIPSVIPLAWRIGAVDVPRDRRRMHRVSIPRAGGLALFFSLFMTCLAWGALPLYLTCTLCGGLLILLVGLADDILSLGALSKLFFQVAITGATVLGSGVSDGRSAPAAVLWVVTLTNAHNFIDGLDGLFAGCASIESGILATVFLLMGVQTDASIAVFLAVACLAFRAYNAYPAMIFAGDCGSGSVGFLLGMLSLRLFESLTVPCATLTALFVFAYPLTDLLTAVLRRLMRGNSPFAADRGHLHHRICAAGLNQPQCVGALLSVCASLGAVGVLLCREEYWGFASFACVAAAWILIRIRHFVMDFA